VALPDFVLADAPDGAGGDGSGAYIGALVGDTDSPVGVPAGDATAREKSSVSRRSSAMPASVGGPLQGAASVLVIEDDESQASTIRSGLEREGFSVTCVGDGVSGLAAFHSLDPDIVVVDAVLPGLSGIDVCRRIRETRSTVPVIVVSARAEELDVVLAMEIGADDFLAKPYRMRVLVARMRAVLRRSPPRKAGAVATAPGREPFPALTVPGETGARVLAVDDLQLFPDRHEVYVRGERVELTRQEFRLLEELLRRAGMLLLRQTLLERIWGSEFTGNGKILSTLIKRLRARIEDDPDNPVRIVTIRGLGYRYERQQPPVPAGDKHGPGSAGHRLARPHSADYRSRGSEVGTPSIESARRRWE